VPQRHADLFEVGFDQVAEDARVDLMLAEQGFVLSEVEAFSHWATFIVVPAHGSILMMVPGRLRVQAGSVGRTVRTLAGSGCYLRSPDGWSRPLAPLKIGPTDGRDDPNCVEESLG
jgi:hypothetical protein